MRDSVGRAGIAVVALGMFGWLGLHMYTQPLASSREAEPVRAFLARAVAGDSAGLAARAAAMQPVWWALAATRRDSGMVRLWSRNVGRVRRTERADTVWITLSNNRSTSQCPMFGRLTAALVGPRDQRRLARLSATCPDIPTGSQPIFP